MLLNDIDCQFSFFNYKNIYFQKHTSKILLLKVLEEKSNQLVLYLPPTTKRWRLRISLMMRKILKNIGNLFHVSVFVLFFFVLCFVLFCLFVLTFGLAITSHVLFLVYVLICIRVCFPGLHIDITSRLLFCFFFFSTMVSTLFNSLSPISPIPPPTSPTSGFVITF